MKDLTHAGWMYAKATMLVAIGCLSFWLLLDNLPTWQRIVLQLLMVWAFARAYYFAFYVIQHYVDNTYRFSGLLGFCRYLFRRRRNP